MQTHVALVGNLSEGFEVHGPYPDFNAASAAHEGDEAWIATLLAPVEGKEPLPQSAEAQAVEILTKAGIRARLHHTGGGVMVTEVTSPTIPGRTVWVTDSEGADGGRFLVGVYPDADGQAWFEALSGPCSEDDLLTHVKRGLSGDAE